VQYVYIHIHALIFERTHTPSYTCINLTEYRALFAEYKVFPTEHRDASRTALESVGGNSRQIRILMVGSERYRALQVVMILIRSSFQTWSKLVLCSGGALLNKDLVNKSAGTWYKFNFPENSRWNFYFPPTGAVLHAPCSCEMIM